LETTKTIRFGAGVLVGTEDVAVCATVEDEGAATAPAAITDAAKK
jgi:hypothetical protein